MRVASRLFWLLLVVAIADDQARAQAVAPARPLFHRDRSFRIPYEVNPADQARLKEVQLFVSTDRGATWRHHTSGPAPTQKEFFTFTSQGNGEHWFTVRTVDFEGRGDPASLTGVQPQLVVVVDTTPPHVELRGMTLPGDEAGIEWIIHDENLDLGTVRVEYRVGSTDWFPINVTPAPTGKTKFRPGVRGPVEIRLRVLDRAANEAVEQITIQSTGVTSAAPVSQPMNGVPAFGPPVPPVTMPSQGQGGFSVPPPPNVSAPMTNLPPGMTPPMQGNNSSFVPTMPGVGTTAPPPSFGSTNPPSMGSAPNTNMYQNVAPAPNPLAVPSVTPPAPAQPVSMPVFPQVRSNLQLINSTKFGINYEIEEIGRSGLAAIALYWSYDGNTWNYHGDDEDQKSPFQVDVDGEGVFGFKLAARSKAGLGDDPPRAGDQPDVWVEVDITAPEIDLRPPQPGRGASSGVLDIQWQARDKNPAPKPISLYYSEEASGPYKPIAEGIENTGRFQWQIPSDPTMPYKFFVRIECKDRAGNIGRTDTAAAVVVDLVRPKLRITRVEASTKASSDLGDMTLPP